jgi:RNA polymerase primary sigma factor
MQEGVVGLLRALERCDPERGVPFWGYASWWVRQAMQQLIAELTRPVVLSDRSLRQLSALKRAHHAYLTEHGHEPSADQTGFPMPRSGTWSRLTASRGQSRNRPAAPTGELGAFGELLADPLAGDAYEQLLDHSEIEQIRALLVSLNERERMALRGRYGLDGPEQSLRDLGEQIGVSGERVRQSSSARWASCDRPRLTNRTADPALHHVPTGDRRGPRTKGLTARRGGLLIVMNG